MLVAAVSLNNRAGRKKLQCLKEKQFLTLIRDHLSQSFLPLGMNNVSQIGKYYDNHLHKHMKNY